MAEETSPQKRFQGPPYYFDRVSIEEQNERLRERLRRKQEDHDQAKVEIEKLKREREKLERDQEKLKRENENLKKEILELKKSFKPHWAKPNKNVLLVEAKKRPKKLGRPKGLKANLRSVPAPDVEVNIAPKKCPHCETKLLKPTHWHSHTQIEIPPPQKVVITKYNIGWCYCSTCKERVTAVTGKLPQSKYGPRLHSLIAYWKFSMGLTLPKIQSLLMEQYQLEIATGQLSAILNRAANHFEETYQTLKAGLKNEKNLNADETSWRNEGNNHWLWSFSNENVSYYTIDRSRGAKVVKETLGESFNGILSSDFFSSYSRLKSKKQKCWTHLLRELRELKKKYPGRPEIISFSKRVRRFYERGEDLKKLFAEGKDIEKKYLRLIDDTDRFVARPYSNMELKTLAKRLYRHRDELYVFIKAQISATNNAAEREIRPAVLMRKTSYGNRSDQGAHSQSVLMSVIRTCKKRGINFTETATQLLSLH
jgi:transposase